MDEEYRVPDRGPEKTPGYQTGASFVKKIRPIGCAFFLMLLIVFLVICFTSGLEPIEDYAPPHSSGYYAGSAETLSELKSELEANVFPYLEGVQGCEVRGEKLRITIESGDFIKTRAALLRYYDKELFELVRG